MKINVEGEEFQIILHRLQGGPLKANDNMHLLTMQFLMTKEDVRRFQIAVQKAPKNEIPQMCIDNIGKGLPE